jgi:hypothetical protein
LTSCSQTSRRCAIPSALRSGVDARLTSCSLARQAFISKLEIATFGAAANHFNSPITLPGSDGRPGEPIIKHVEHFANNEFVAAIGVLSFQVEPSRGLAAVPQNDGNDTRFYGSLFRRDDVQGRESRCPAGPKRSSLDRPADLAFWTPRLTRRVVFWLEARPVEGLAGALDRRPTMPALGLFRRPLAGLITPRITSPLLPLPT